MTWNWWVLAVVPVAWFVQNCVHELSHLIVGLFQGLKPTGFYPYPHKHNGKWFFARYTFEYPDNLTPIQINKLTRIHNPRYISPFYAGLIWCGLFVGIILLVPSSWRIFFVPFVACGLVDALWFWRGYFWGREGNDGQRWRYGG